jgi:hypothetical protein
MSYSSSLTDRKWELIVPLLPKKKQTRPPKWSKRAIIIDSQAVKNTCNASVESRGFCSYKATNGIKRYRAVDSLGFPFEQSTKPLILSRVKYPQYIYEAKHWNAYQISVLRK